MKVGRSWLELPNVWYCLFLHRLWCASILDSCARGVVSPRRGKPRVTESNLFPTGHQGKSIRLRYVRVTANPVNDGQVAQAISISTAEDAAAIIHLAATDVDNAQGELHFAIQTQPAHGTLALLAIGSYRSRLMPTTTARIASPTTSATVRCTYTTEPWCCPAHA